MKRGVKRVDKKNEEEDGRDEEEVEMEVMRRRRRKKRVIPFVQLIQYCSLNSHRINIKIIRDLG